MHSARKRCGGTIASSSAFVVLSQPPERTCRLKSTPSSQPQHAHSTTPVSAPLRFLRHDLGVVFLQLSALARVQLRTVCPPAQCRVRDSRCAGCDELLLQSIRTELSGNAEISECCSGVTELRSAIPLASHIPKRSSVFGCISDRESNADYNCNIYLGRGDLLTLCALSDSAQSPAQLA